MVVDDELQTDALAALTAAERRHRARKTGR